MDQPETLKVYIFSNMTNSAPSFDINGTEFVFVI